MTPLEGLSAALVCIVAVVVGVTALGGWPVALIVGGGLGLIATVLLYDPRVRRRRDNQKRPPYQ